MTTMMMVALVIEIQVVIEDRLVSMIPLKSNAIFLALVSRDTEYLCTYFKTSSNQFFYYALHSVIVLPEFADLYQQLKSADTAYARQCMDQWERFILGPPNRPTMDRFGLKSVSLMKQLL